jgi:photosystem II stability/assembly factor-like uncharacterized protein
VVVGVGTILRTTNGGTIWTSQLGGNNLLGVFFIDSNTGTTVGEDGTILRTTNGGADWTIQTSRTMCPLNGVYFTDPNAGTVVGECGIILRTTNGGLAWTSQSSGTTNGLTAVSFMDANTGTVVGQYGKILRTTNGGATWTTQPTETANELYGVFLIDVNTGWAVGENGTILHTSSGGEADVSEQPFARSPEEMILAQNYPNPFTSSTTISYSLPQSCVVSLEVFGALGQAVTTLASGEESAGEHSVTFNAANLPDGVYFYRLTAGGQAQYGTMAIVR